MIESPLPICFFFFKLFGGGMDRRPEYGFYEGHSSGLSKHEAGHLPVFTTGGGDGGCFMRYQKYQGICSEL